jgi:hypothetical protein
LKYILRKFAVSEKLAFIINDAVDDTIQLMLKEEKPFNPIVFCDFMIYNIIASTAYGEKYRLIKDIKIIITLLFQ